jgi:alkylation response protein AidB-like acyl-CoA dehydrogenase
MKREIYDEDHEAFRPSVREFLERSVVPHVEQHSVDPAIPREFWLEAGKQGLLGLEIPEEYDVAGAGDDRFNAARAEELAKVSAAWRSCGASRPTSPRPTSSRSVRLGRSSTGYPASLRSRSFWPSAWPSAPAVVDVTALNTTAVEDGDDWVINGSRTFIGPYLRILHTGVRRRRPSEPPRHAGARVPGMGQPRALSLTIRAPRMCHPKGTFSMRSVGGNDGR